MIDISGVITTYGGNPTGLRLFDVEDPALLPYATLVSARKGGNHDLDALLGVYEWQAAPLLILVNGEAIRDDAHFMFLRRCVALRGDAPYLAVIKLGTLTIYRASLDHKKPANTRVSETVTEDKEMVIPYLSNFRPKPVSQRKRISKIVLRLLTETIGKLQKLGINGVDAVSLAGRTLFLRFLADRNLLPAMLGQDDDVLKSAKQAKTAFAWLDKTFNGDFLTISDGLLDRMDECALHILGDIMCRAPGGQLHLGWKEKWDYLDFAHIPVGVLSEAYEEYMREYNPDKQRDEGSYYTPRAIADLMVKGAFHALRVNGKAHNAIVLDPAAGAGVFLITAFRQLVAERWKKDGTRPDTKTLRSILYNNLVGFDINEAALRFAALGLYLISIELDPEPEPVEKLIFKQNLRGIVLHYLGETDKSSLGSLGKMVGPEHNGRYDLVIGNPPWPGDKKLAEWETVKEIVHSIAAKRLGNKTEPPPIPNEVLDLPFLWRAMDWAKPKGQIAFALHARLLFQQGNGMIEARSAIFKALDVTGIVNGSELRQTSVWPGISAPFCLLFARNQVPSRESGFRFVSPHIEESLNASGALRVDAVNAEIVAAGDVVERPDILKVLFRGSALDLEVLDRVRSRDIIPLNEYWETLFGKTGKALKFVSTGYQIVCESTEHPQSSNHMKGMPDLSSKATLPIKIDVDKLNKFELDFLHRCREREVYTAPLLLVHKSPPASGERISVSMSESDLVFNEVYYGYSVHKHSSPIQLARYLTLLLGSKPALWFVLMTSGEFGFERDVIEKITIDKIPVVPFEALSAEAIRQVNVLFEALADNESPNNWNDVDLWAAELYGLRQQDLDVITDTLHVALPFSANRKAAQSPIAGHAISIFCEVLKNDLNVWADNKTLQVESKSIPCCPWGIIKISSSGSPSRSQRCTEWPAFLQIADSLAAAQIIYPEVETGVLWIARLNQARYWTRSQARLTARKIIWEHIDFLTGGIK